MQLKNTTGRERDILELTKVPQEKHFFTYLPKLHFYWYLWFNIVNKRICLYGKQTSVGGRKEVEVK